MECALVSKLANGPQWVYEIKLDGYRAIAVNSEGKLTLFSRRAKSFNRQFSHIVEALADLPENAVKDLRRFENRVNLPSELTAMARYPSSLIS